MTSVCVWYGCVCQAWSFQGLILCFISDHSPRRTVPCVLRYYLKNNLNTETLVPDELRSELIREAHISLLQLNTTEVASQLTLEDFKVFKDIEPTEYIDDLFKINEKYGRPSLLKFSEVKITEFYIKSHIMSGSFIRKYQARQNLLHNSQATFSGEKRRGQSTIVFLFL